MNDQITIFLTTPEALLFKEYQRFHATFQLLCEKGVFDVKSGKVIMHFDENGVIQKIERNDNLFDARIKSYTHTPNI